MLGLLKRVDWAETAGEFGSLLHEAACCAVCRRNTARVCVKRANWWHGA